MYKKVKSCTVPWMINSVVHWHYQGSGFFLSLYSVPCHRVVPNQLPSVWKDICRSFRFPNRTYHTQWKKRHFDPFVLSFKIKEAILKKTPPDCLLPANSCSHLIDPMSHMTQPKRTNYYWLSPIMLTLYFWKCALLPQKLKAAHGRKELKNSSSSVRRNGPWPGVQWYLLCLLCFVGILPSL